MLKSTAVRFFNYSVLLTILSAVALAEVSNNHPPSRESAQACVDSLSVPKILTESENEANWNLALKSVQEIRNKVKNQDSAVFSVLTGALSEEFVWLNSDPGAAKTSLARETFKRLLAGIPEKDKKIFLQQFHVLLAEGKIIGFPVIEQVLKAGRYQINAKTSMVGDKFLYFIADEVEKANPATLNVLLSVLNERAAFHGNQVVKAILSSGVFTSNKSISEFIATAKDDRPSREALLDRIAIKVGMMNQQSSVEKRLELVIDETTGSVRKRSSPSTETVTPLVSATLLPIVNSMQISPELTFDIAKIIWQLDPLAIDNMRTSRADVLNKTRKHEAFPANQFSIRSIGKINIFKAAVVADALMNGVSYKDFKRTVGLDHLHLLSVFTNYGSPGKLVTKTIDLKEYTSNHSVASGQPGLLVTAPPYGDTADARSIHLLPGQWRPYENLLTVYNKNRSAVLGEFQFSRTPSGLVLTSKPEPRIKYSLLPSDLSSLINHITQLESASQIEISRPQYEINPLIDIYLNKKTISEAAKQELRDSKESLVQFASVLNKQILESTTADSAISNKIESTPKPAVSKSKKKKPVKPRNHLQVSSKEQTKQAYIATQNFYRKANTVYKNLDYAVQGIFTAILAREHAILFGPPGAAKTQLASTILKASIRGLKREQSEAILRSLITKMANDKITLSSIIKEIHTSNPKHYELFMLQFHKLLPEGVILGFPKIEKQLNEGEEEIEIADSLACEKFIFAILDEADKANPQTLTALLALLNERELFSGGQTFVAALRTAIITSNKFPSELLDSYREDRSSGEALLDRGLIKILMLNKFTEFNDLLDFITMKFSGQDFMTIKDPLPISQLTDLADNIEIPESLAGLLAEIYEKFLGERLQVQNETYREHTSEEGSREFPDYYIGANSTASDRSWMKSLINVFRAQILVSQLTEGVSFDDLRLTAEPEDIALFFNTISYWTPLKMKSTGEKGSLSFLADDTQLKAIIDSGRYSDRILYFLKKIQEDGTSYSTISSDVWHNFHTKFIDYINQNPLLWQSQGKQNTDSKVDPNDS